MQPKSIILFFYGYILFFRRQKSIGIQNLKVFEKYIVSALGEVTKAEFRQREDFKNELR
ncbi:hypothetical protein ACLW2P_000059 [Campylobacter jejuni]